MRKIKYKDNTLIKKNQLVIRLKKEGVRRIDKQAISELSHFFDEYTDRLIKLFRWEIQTNGRKTLKEEDVRKVLSNIKKEEKGWEI